MKALETFHQQRYFLGFNLPASLFMKAMDSQHFGSNLGFFFHWNPTLTLYQPAMHSLKRKWFSKFGRYSRLISVKTITLQSLNQAEFKPHARHAVIFAQHFSRGPYFREVGVGFCLSGSATKHLNEKCFSMACIE